MKRTLLYLLTGLLMAVLLAACGGGDTASGGDSGGEAAAGGDEPLKVVLFINGVLGDNLEGLQQIVEDTYLQLNESERKARTALSRLEAGTLRKFREFQDSIHG